MTREEFAALKRGDVVEWKDGVLGMVRSRSDEGVLIVWEDTSDEFYYSWDDKNLRLFQGGAR